MKYKLQEDYKPHPFKWWHLPLLLLLVGGTIYACIQYGEKRNGNGNLPDWQTNSGLVFGTSYNISYQSNQNYENEIKASLQKVDNSLSPFNTQSTISAINNNKSTQMDEMLYEVVKKAYKVYNRTNGAFDITVAPLVNAWGFGFEKSKQINTELVDSIMQFVGMDKIQLDDHQIVKKDSRVMLDCSAIAKGYGVDAVCRTLDGLGVRNYMVEIGGEIKIKGVNNQQRPWRIGINEPIDDSLSVANGIQNVIEMSDGAIATSGNYRNFYIMDNKKYAHTIDPHTGYPVQHNILSSTVIAKDCMTADAYATAFMVMGLEKAKEILQKTPEIKAYFIFSDSEGNNCTWHSEGLNLQNDQ